MPVDSSTVAASATAALLTKEGLAAHLGVSLRTIDNMVAARSFPQGVRVGRKLFWTHGVVQKWVTRKFGPQEAWRG
jgi:predicted DNA-binding transcriptional regulator AlpA